MTNLLTYACCGLKDSDKLFDVIYLLFKRGLILVNGPNKYKYSPLMHICDGESLGKIRTAKLLIANGADVNACIYDPNKSSMIPSHKLRRHTVISPITISHVKGDGEMMKLLMDNGADIGPFVYFDCPFYKTKGFKWLISYEEGCVRKYICDLIYPREYEQESIYENLIDWKHAFSTLIDDKSIPNMGFIGQGSIPYECKEYIKLPKIDCNIWYLFKKWNCGKNIIYHWKNHINSTDNAILTYSKTEQLNKLTLQFCHYIIVARCVYNYVQIYANDITWCDDKYEYFPKYSEDDISLQKMIESYQECLDKNLASNPMENMAG